MAKYAYDDDEYERNDWPWYGSQTPNPSSYFPHWFHEGTINEWEQYLERLMPRRGVYTPDMPELNKETYQKVFVYGTLKRGGFNHSYLRSSIYLGKAWTKVRCLKMYQTDNNIPVVFYTSQTDGHQVQGELYLCRPGIVRNLDYLEANGYFYKRRKIVIEREDGKQDKAFMYFGVKPAHRSEAELTLSTLFTRKKTGTKYFSYTPRLIEGNK